MAAAGQGYISEWNEATFKIIRIHEIQDAMNNFKITPLNIVDGKFSYEWYARNIDLLYGEGRSKYKEKERVEVDGIKKIVFLALEYMPPCVMNVRDDLTGRSKSYEINQENLKNFMQVCELFEQKVKDYNDAHGLTTKNREYGGLF